MVFLRPTLSNGRRLFVTEKVPTTFVSSTSVNSCIVLHTTLDCEPDHPLSLIPIGVLSGLSKLARICFACQRHTYCSSTVVYLPRMPALLTR